MPLREQLIAQIKLAILSQDLKPGQKLPSTREVARRFKIHSNTVSAAYRELSESGWVDMRAGSGIYVRRFKPENAIEAQLGLDNLIVEFLQVARRASSFVITDAATAARMPPGVRVRVFRVIADSSLSELRHYVDRFLTRPVN